MTSTAQVKELLRQYIVDHGLRAGDPLPVGSDLAMLCAANKNTVSRAITQLKKEGILAGPAGGVARVAASDPDTYDPVERMAAELRGQLTPASLTRLAERLLGPPDTVDAAAERLLVSAAELRLTLAHQRDHVESASMAAALEPPLQLLADVVDEARKIVKRREPDRAPWWTRASEDAAHLVQDLHHLKGA